MLAFAGLTRVLSTIVAVDVLIPEEPKGVTELVILGGAKRDPHAMAYVRGGSWHRVREPAGMRIETGGILG